MLVARSAEPPRECQPALMEAVSSGLALKIPALGKFPSASRQPFDLTAKRFALARGHHDHNPQRMPAGRLGAQCVVVAGSSSLHLWPFSGSESKVSKLFVCFLLFSFVHFCSAAHRNAASASKPGFISEGWLLGFFSDHSPGPVNSMVSVFVFLSSAPRGLSRQRLHLLKKLCFWLSFSS